MTQVILIVEDEVAIADTITYPLETEGFTPHWVSTCQDAHKALNEHDVRLIILDVGLPDGNGFEFCKEVRKTSNVPIIFLTARKEEIDRIVGLEIGADDYVTKPFSPRELSSRVKAILRRTTAFLDESAPISHFQVNEAGHQITYFNQILDLSRFEYRILTSFISRPGWIFSREQLIEKGWDEPESILDRTIDAHVKSLRKKLKQVRPDREAIETHRGMGYSLVADE